MKKYLLFLLIFLGCQSNLVFCVPQTIRHDHWCANGRCLVFEGTNQRAYKSNLGQRNIQDSTGTWQPYIWDATNRIAKFAGGEIRFVGVNIQYWRDDNLIFISQFFPEVRPTTTWNRVSVIRAPIFIEEVDTLSAIKLLKIHCPIETVNQADTVTVLIGGSEYANIAITMRAKLAGEYRLNWEIRRPRSSATILRQRTSKIDTTLLDVGRQYSDFKVFWHRSEVPDHRVQGTTRTEILLKEGTFQAGEIKKLFPETFGPTTIQAEADDGEQQEATPLYDNVDGIYDGDNLYLEAGDNNSVWWNGYRWDNIDLSGVPTSIDAGTQIVFFNSGDNNTPANVDATLFGTDSYDPGQYANSASNRPSDDTGTTATQALTGQTGDLTQNVRNVVQEWVETDGNSYTGSQAMRFFLNSGTEVAAEYWGIAQDYDGAGANEETTFTIVYTASAGGGSGPGNLPQVMD